MIKFGKTVSKFGSALNQIQFDVSKLMTVLILGGGYYMVETLINHTAVYDSWSLRKIFCTFLF